MSEVLGWIIGVVLLAMLGWCAWQVLRFLGAVVGAFLPRRGEQGDRKSDLRQDDGGSFH